MPGLSILYEDAGPAETAELDDSGVGEDLLPVSRPSPASWAKKIPLLGPFWCVRNTHSTTVRRRYVRLESDVSRVETIVHIQS